MGGLSNVSFSSGQSKLGPKTMLFLIFQKGRHILSSHALAGTFRFSGGLTPGLAKTKLWAFFGF